MKEDEYYDRIYQSLITLLGQQGLSWIVQDVNEQIVMGKVMIPTPEEKKKAPRGKKLRTYSTAYSHKERLHLLINTIRHVVVHGASIEKEVLSFYLEPDADSQAQFRPLAIKFYSEVEQEEVAITDEQQAPLRYAQAQRLGNILDRLQELLDDDH